ncbi:hypothetical protein A3F36_02295 [Candidatus Peribacteria bacterium RIFCSPHIGHO2_12_FULL_55_11]|nr:MAG: hypothetical protein A3F36_02295 [Candidatus Peribacteria bacterium RIFCSPHIGHO2_12_FULL_55_11]
MVLINDNSSTLAIGDPLPHFVLPATDLITVDTHLIKDPVLVVVFTCNHCPYAQAYELRLKELMEDFDEEGAQFILINSNDAEQYPEDSFENMHVKKKETGWPCEYCFDEDQSVAKSFGALCTPHCFVFDRHRKLKYKGRIDDSWKDEAKITERTLRDAIAAVVRDEEPKVQEKNAIGCSIKWKQKT